MDSNAASVAYPSVIPAKAGIQGPLRLSAHE